MQAKSAGEEEASSAQVVTTTNLNDDSFNPNERCLWAFNIEKWNPTEEEWEEGMSYLEETERNRINRFKFPLGGGKYVTGRHNESAKSSLIGRLLILAMLADELEMHPQEARLARTSKNKPFLQNAPHRDFNFNVSHAGAWVVLAWDHSSLVGIDVMKVEVRGRDRRVDPFIKDFQRCFTVREWQTIHEGITEVDEEDKDAGKLHRFYWHWTLKESYIKAVGIGLGFTLDRADFSLEVTEDETDIDPKQTQSEQSGKRIGTATVAIDSELRKDWFFELCYLDEDHVVTIAYGPHDDAEESWKQRALLEDARVMRKEKEEQGNQEKEKEKEEGKQEEKEDKGGDDENVKRKGSMKWEVLDFERLMSHLKKHGDLRRE